jgi:HEAT repeat protein
VQFQNSDYWTRHGAINSVAAFGAKAAVAIGPLTKLLSDESPVIRLKAAKALFLITGDPAHLEKQLELVFATGDAYDPANAIETIKELNHSGGKFVRYVLTDLRQSPTGSAEIAIQALQAIGTEVAVAALKESAQSSDWNLRSQAAEALRQVQKFDGKGRP